MAQSKMQELEPGVYERLWEFDAGFAQIMRALRSLEKNRTFNARELQRLGAWLEEARAATASYLAGAIEEAETKQAGRLFQARLALERKQS
jgi:hypothetical protein